ncbi:N-acetylmuramoyl-L-alanine amidase family protein [Gracilibacillus timonensis]|uniref:N-acetylmuramoyl-L-alanine amidase family protein n=1 Tax=Gracilibacillus timonensis TaxID=1816696 RepID=UPI0008251761|nr:N-acetylmuramoyl-L-alanine amidase [Gracilibacillus timonensis]
MKKGILMITLSVLLILIFILVVSINNPRPKMESNSDLKVVIDAGHGGKDNGATGASGKYEKKFTLSLSKKIEEKLKQDPEIEVFMTRTEDNFISQESRYRPKYANKLNADLFLSIHGNTFSSPEVAGTETFYYHKDSRRFAKMIQKHVVEATGFNDRGTTKKDLFVVKDTEMPAVLLEVGYLTNPKEESEMWTDDFQSRVATSIVEGIKEYKEKAEKRGIFNWLF